MPWTQGGHSSPRYFRNQYAISSGRESPFMKLSACGEPSLNAVKGFIMDDKITKTFADLRFSDYLEYLITPHFPAPWPVR